MIDVLSLTFQLGPIPAVSVAVSEERFVNFLFSQSTSSSSSPLSSPPPPPEHHQGTLRKEMHLTRMMSIIVITFLTLNMPRCIIGLFELTRYVPRYTEYMPNPDVSLGYSNSLGLSGICLTVVLGFVKPNITQ